MKKLLLCMLTVLYACALNAMQDNSQLIKKKFDTGSLSASIAPEASLSSGIVTRTTHQIIQTAPTISMGIALAATTANNAIAIASDISATIATRIAALSNRLRADLEKAFTQSDNQAQNNNNNNAHDLQTWEEITTDPAILEFLTKKIHGSIKEISGQDNPEQDNDAWQDLYHDKDTINELLKALNDKRSTLNKIRVARIMDASKALEEAQQSLPENLRKIINANLDGLDPIKTLEAISTTYTCYMERAAENFERRFIDQTITENLKKCDIKDPQQIYAYLDSNNEDGVMLSHAECLKRLAAKRTATTNEKDLMCVRQIEYIIGDPFRKEAFDAYISGGENNLKSLQVDPSRIVELVTCRNNIGLAKSEINNVDKQLSTVDAKLEKLTQHLQTLN